MKYDLLKTLLPHLETYERAYPKEQSPQHFAVWLLRQTTDGEQMDGYADGPSEREKLDGTIGKLLIYLNRYMRMYTRKALEGSPLGTMDEFVYLVMLTEQGALTKSDLIQRNRHEKPTGMEIIRRLLALGLIGQTDDLDDRRSKRLTITPLGIAVSGQVAGQMGKASTLLTGNLSIAEKLLLLQLLDKLEHFHQLVLAKMKKGDRG
jgi:DNA-binding MarR family transcriptional regulator